MAVGGPEGQMRRARLGDQVLPDRPVKGSSAEREEVAALSRLRQVFEREPAFAAKITGRAGLQPEGASSDPPARAMAPVAEAKR